ncbi:MAG: response regulator transcription factor [Phaeodactylibacter sp.]|nr:response regulator transcription factor [Phaeodactylibacter sp.]MCB9303247.1 response regulator transcription factor [Lewinellaceae bacterium]
MLTQLVPKILIIESQMIIAADMSLQFSKLGYDVIGISTRSEDALKTLETNRPDIVLMSIEIQGKIDGLKTARTIMESFQIPVVLLSAKVDKDTFKGVIDTQPYAFIAKPFEKKDLQRGVETALDRMAKEGRWANEKQIPLSEDGLFVHQKDQLIKVKIKDILFVEANRNHCQLATPEKKYQLTVPLKIIEDQLPDNQFIRVHRSFLVNLHEINVLQEHGQYLMIHNHKIPISRRLRPNVLKRIRRI